MSIDLLLIAYQDLKERNVWAWLLVLYPFFGASLFYQNSEPAFFWYSIGINLVLVAFVILMVFLISKWMLKKPLLTALGLGDILFFIGFAVSFPVFSFLNFFVFSILFTFAFHTLLGKFGRTSHKTIPLAGSMAIFLILVYLVHWVGLYQKIYLM